MENVLLAVSVASAITYTIVPHKPSGTSRTFIKTSSVASLAAISALLHAPTLLIAAQVGSFVGDAFLAYEGEGPFLCGLGSFLIGHLCYTAHFAQGGGELIANGLDNWRSYVALLLFFLACGTCTLLVPRVTSNLRIPIVAYSGAIYSMIFMALMKMESSVVVGAILFMTSDTILAFQTFLVPKESSHQTWMEYAVWVLYYSGQFGIMQGGTSFPLN